MPMPTLELERQRIDREADQKKREAEELYRDLQIQPIITASPLFTRVWDQQPSYSEELDIVISSSSSPRR
jgi:hypothetical protein